MKDEEKPKEQLINELREMRQRIVELEESETKRKRVEEELSETRDYLENLLNYANAPIIVWDQKFRITKFNHAFERLTGRSASQLMGAPLHILFPEERREEAMAHIRRTAEGERWEVVEIPILRADGAISTVLWNSATLYATDGTTVVATIAQGQDITGRVKAEDALRESEKRFKDISFSMADWIWEVDKDGKYTFASGKAKQVLGYAPKEIIGITPFELMPEDEAKRVGRIFKRVSSEKKPIVDLENWNLTKQGEKVCLLTNGVPILDEKGNLLGYRGVDKDITERKKAVEALRVEKAYLEQLFESSPEAIAVVDNDSRVLRANSEFTRMFGYTLDEALGRSIDELLAPEDLREEAFSLTKQVIEGEGVALESVRQRKDGTLVDVSILGTPVKVEGGQVAVYAIYRDITKRKRAEVELRESEEKYRTLVESIEEGLGTVDEKENFIFANGAAAKIFGYAKKEELIGKNLRKFTTPEEFKRVLEQTSLRKAGKSSRYELAIIRKNGESRIITVTASPVIGDDGKFLGTFGIFRDITERKQAEEERVKLEHQLRQSQKMEAIGTLASGIAHDFNNLLGGILGYSSLLLSKLPTEDANRKYVELIERAGNRASELTNRLLGFARRGKYEVKPVDLNQLIGGVVELLSASVDKRIKIRTDLCGENPFTKGDPNQLEQVLMNLCVNAQDAMAGGGELSICSQVVHLDEKFVSKHLGATPGDDVRLSISDTGMGMDEETRAKIFDPFFTTKEQGRGTGLGLSMVYGIVKNHGGYLSVYSEVGKGTTFDVYLPLIQGVLSQPRKGRVEPISGSESILVVDDEEILRDLMKDILEGLGYGVMLASDGREAVDVYREHKDGIDLVIVDMMMPQMGGRETYQELRRINPGVKALLASGYSKDTAAQQILDLGVKDFLHKPFSLEEIAHKVREVLDTQ